MLENDNKFGVASFVCGAAALVFFLMLINIPLAAAAILFGVLQLVYKRKKLWAILGMSAALFSVCLMLVGWAVIFYGTAKMNPDYLERFRQELFWQYQNQAY